ncbi:LTA synthase family protein [Leptospira gomenensis]|uniref:LTA synthase family protein n=1 Tax=Leptospira gomenensis TaxID=2484974 RepID=A0A5F1YEI2_9LEPT|nr:LTA synthase family protein [Leptospira gomenensis]TGK37546.1 LTA synthase family protein [Leptospira gomenensis]TGK39448.1 LTA synthase family protein [Leptospira gomenensis]TGK43130.1 LTA synthase family protein [Leptospira gomenensis]TGK55041.1 LTA synthase family protein [Leptospira gomenensis]
MRIRIPDNLRILFGYTFAFMILFTIYRIGFFFTFSSKLESAPISEILVSFLVGLRFDLSVCCMLLAPFVFLSSAHPLNRWKPYSYLWELGPIPVFFWAFGHSIADILYFGETNKHLGYEGFVFLGPDFLVILRSFLSGNPFVAAASSVFVLTLFPTCIFLYIQNSLYSYKRSERIRETVSGLILLPILFVGVRGGLQSRPLRPSDAMTSRNYLVNQLALNGIFTSVMDIGYQSIPSNLRMSYEESVRVVRKEIGYSGAEFVSEEYPILRETKEKSVTSTPNVVLILLESWTGKYAYSEGTGRPDGKTVAPYFESLIPQGVYFPSFFASGGRTTNGLISTLTGIPDGPGLTVVRTPRILSRFGGLGTLLKSLGYQTVFLHGGDAGFDNMNFLFEHWGFDRILDKGYFDSLNRYESGPWGYYDGDLLNELHEILMHQKSPVLITTLTLTTHYPYKLPSSAKPVFPLELEENEYFNVYRYADDSIRNFMEKAKNASYFRDTVFIFVGDHSHHRNLDYYEDRNVPFLIYAPGRIRPKLDYRISSQLDVLPTVLGILGKKVRFSAMGRDLLDPSLAGGGAYFAFGNLFGWIENNWIFYSFTDKIRKSSFSIRPRIGETEECKEDPALCETYHSKAKSFWNLSYELMNRNKIYPSETKK